jgi:hypothetical protein
MDDQPQAEGLVTANNRTVEGAAPKVDAQVVRARKRLSRLYKRLRRHGGWRAVAREIGSSNVRYAYNFAEHGLLPGNLREREILLRWRPRQDGGREQNWSIYPSELEPAILSVMASHTGRQRAIGRSELLADLARMGHQVRERTVREAIKQLRRLGHLICSMPGVDGGYYLAQSMDEFEEFDRVELGAKIADMDQTRQAMRQAARRKFSLNYQMELLR